MVVGKLEIYIAAENQMLAVKTVAVDTAGCFGAAELYKDATDVANDSVGMMDSLSVEIFNAKFISYYDIILFNNCCLLFVRHLISPFV